MPLPVCWMLVAVDAGRRGRWSPWTLVAVDTGRRGHWSLWTLVAVDISRCRRRSLWTQFAVWLSECLAGWPRGSDLRNWRVVLGMAENVAIIGGDGSRSSRRTSPVYSVGLI